MGMFQYCTARFFCCCCTLQSGVIMSVVVLTTLMITMIFMVVYTVVILHTWGGLLWIPILIAFGHAVFVLIAIYLAFFGAYKENATYMINAACFMFIAFLIYFVASIISYMPNVWTYTCVVHRCPDHIWMENSFWRHKEFGNKTTVTYGDKGFEESGKPEEQWRGINLKGQNGSVWTCRWQNKRDRVIVQPPKARQKEEVRDEETLNEADLPALGPGPELPDLEAPSSALNVSQLPQDGEATAQSPELNLTQGSSQDQLLVGGEQEKTDNQPSYGGLPRPPLPPYYTDVLPPPRPVRPPVPRRPRPSRSPPPDVVGVTWSADRNEPSDLGWPWWSGGLSRPQNYLLSTDIGTNSLNQSQTMTNNSYEFSQMMSAINNDAGALRSKVVLRNIAGSSRNSSKNQSTIVQFEVIKIKESDLDSCKEPILPIRLPTLGMMLSIVFNVTYAAFLMYITFTYIAYSNEIKDAVPLGFSKEDWMALQE